MLSVEGGKALVISDMCLDAMPYYLEEELVTWETSSLRAWLNGKFLEAVFTPEEQEAILTASVNKQNDPSWEVNGGWDTEDKVFLLSIIEAKSLFSSDDDPMARITPYALARGAYEYDHTGYPPLMDLS